MITRRFVLFAMAAFASPAFVNEDGMESELHIAANANDADRVKQLLAAGATFAGSRARSSASSAWICRRCGSDFGDARKRS